jgi:hypothetical protein
VRKQLAASGEEPVGADAPAHNDRDPSARQRLGHVPCVRERDVEDPHAAGTPDADPPHDESPDHPARDTHDDTHADPHPNADAVRRSRARREEDDRMVIAGLGAARHLRLNAQLGRAAGPDGELAW